MSPLFINALGVNNAMGGGVDDVYNSLFLVGVPPAEEKIKLISGRSALVRRVNAELPVVSTGVSRFDTRNNRLLAQAAGQIEKQISALIEKYGNHRVAIILGTSTSGILESEAAFQNGRLGTFNYYKQEISSPSEFLSALLALRGLNYTVSTACSSSAKVFIEAQRLINAGLCDAALIGGVDSLCSLTVDGFDSLDSVSATMTNSFSRNRDGINIGEGAALFIVSKDEGPARLLGYGESSDAFHSSSPDPEGLGGEIAIRNALKMAGLEPKLVSYINLHATGTIKNDSMESLLVNRVFGDEVPVSGTKAFIGHTLGAAGAQEAALCYLALVNHSGSGGKLPTHHWDGEADPLLARLNLVTGQTTLKTKVCMSNSFAFGGNNVSLILGGA